MKYKDYDILSVRRYKFSDLNLNDSFFDTLKEDYPEFQNWFIKKGDKTAFVVKEKENIQAFLYMKVEKEEEDYSHFIKPFSPGERLKIGTFKISKNGLYLGERFFRIILEHAIINDVEEVYVTIFPKRPEQKKLIEFLDTFGFTLFTKNKITNELVYVRKMKCIQFSEPNLCNYPYIKNSQERKFYMLAIDADYHTKLIPDSILREENPDEITSKISASNAVQKTYIGNYRINPKPGDILIYYRNKPVGDNRPAKYAATITGFGLVSQHYRFIGTYEEVSSIVSKRTVLTEVEIKDKIRKYKGVNILKFFDIYSFRKRPIRNFLISQQILKSIGFENGYERHEYPTKEITREQFEAIFQEAKFKKGILFI
ncbi:hypothetical protein [Peribacillus asahii]|uniref:hypothetical protein n=1 Tax=Peribacillus asahii TaxID=228899 RepID=UPI00207A7DD4|nr:hypothetical protein [Peribacillus asahii]USK71726.1 hypothetical protein LIS76_08225 [Peribacillus asahii]